MTELAIEQAQSSPTSGSQQNTLNDPQTSQLSIPQSPQSQQLIGVPENHTSATFTPDFPHSNTTPAGALSEGIMTQVSRKFEGVAMRSAHHRSDVTQAEPNQSVASVHLAHAANHPSTPQAANGIVPQQAFSTTSAATAVLPADLPDIPQSTASNNPHYVVLHGATFSGPVTFVMYPTTPQTISPQADDHLTVSGHPLPSQSGGMSCPEYSSTASQPVSRAASLHKSHPDMASPVSSQLTLRGDQAASLDQRESQITKNASAKIMVSNGFRRAIVVFPTLHTSRKVGMLLDSGSDVNVMPISLLENLGLCDCIDRTATLLCLSFSGHDIETVGSITINWAGTRHSWKYRTVFYVLPESNKAVDEMVLGAASIAKYKLLTIRIFGGRLRRLLPDSPPDERTKNNRIEHEKYKQDKRAMMAERWQKKEVAEPARQGTG